MKWSWRIAAGIALAVTASGASAQGGQHRLGLMVGANFATIGGEGADQIANKENRVGFLAGGYAEIGVHRNIAISPEAYYTMKGVKGGEGGVDAEFKVDFVEVPVLLKVVFPSEGGKLRLRPHLFAGPAISFQVGCKAEFTSSGTSLSIDCEDPDAEAEIKDVDFGVLVGGGIDIGPAFVGVRYDFGLTNLNDDPAAASDEDFKSRAFSIVAGVSIPVGRR
jgi:hypothetical protein